MPEDEIKIKLDIERNEKLENIEKLSEHSLVEQNEIKESLSNFKNIELIKIKGEDGKTPKKGEDYYTEKDVEEIVGKVKKLIPDPKPGDDGKTPIKGEDYFTPEEIDDFLAVAVKKVLSKIPTPKIPTAEEIAKKVKIEPEKLDYDSIALKVFSSIKKDFPKPDVKAIVKEVKKDLSIRDLKDGADIDKLQAKVQGIKDPGITVEKDGTQVISLANSINFKSGFSLQVSGGKVDVTSTDIGGDVVGPASAVDSRIAVFDGTTGKLIKDGGNTLSEFLLLTGRSGGQKIIGGTATTDDLTFQTTSGVGAAGADMHFLVGNNGATEAMTILNSGNVGIGTSTPAQVLSVVGNIYSSGSILGKSYLQPSNSLFLIGVNGVASDGFVEVGDNSAGRSNGIKFYPGDSSPAVTIASSSNVGIGTTGPGYKLEVKASAATEVGGIALRSSSTASPLVVLHDTTDDGVISLYSSATKRILLDSAPSRSSYINAGNIGIGTTSPLFKLDIRGSVSTADILLNVSNSIDQDFYVKISERTASNKRAILGMSTDTNMAFEIATSEKMRIQNNGNVGIGTTGPTALLDVNSDILRLRTAKTPATSGASGNTGDLAWDATYFYICVAANSWHRALHATW